MFLILLCSFRLFDHSVGAEIIIKCSVENEMRDVKQTNANRTVIVLLLSSDVVFAHKLHQIWTKTCNRMHCWFEFLHLNVYVIARELQVFVYFQFQYFSCWKIGRKTSLIIVCFLEFPCSNRFVESEKKTKKKMVYLVFLSW